MTKLNRKPQINVNFFSFAAASLLLIVVSLGIVSTTLGSDAGLAAAPAGAPTATGASSDPVKLSESVSQTIHVNPGHGSASDNNPGSSDRPVRTLSRAMSIARELNKKNTSVKVLVYPGTYRESTGFRSVNTAVTVIEATQPGKAIISGSDIWTNWNSQGNNTYTHHWPHNWGLSPVPNWGGDAPDVPEVLRRRELVFVNGKLLRQVTRSSDLSGDTFYVDEGRDTLTVKLNSGTDIRNMTVEVAVREMPFNINDSRNVILRGLVFQHANSHFDDGAVWVGSSTGIILENNIFQWNSGGGLGFGRVTNIETRGNKYLNNGVTGFGGSRVVNLLSENEVANNNNFRGGWGNYLGWSVAGVKHLLMRDATYRNLQTCYNQAHGFWLDTDNKNILADNVFSCTNSSVGVYIEANQGPVTLRNSIVANNGREGIRGANSENVRVENNIFYGNGVAQIYFSGENSGRSITDWQTGQSIRLDPGENWTVRNNIAIGKNSNHWVWEFTYTPGPFDLFKRTADMDGNTLYHRARSTGFRFNGGKTTDFNGYKGTIGREHNSKYQDVCFRNPDKNDFTRCDGSSPIATPQPGPTQQPVTPQPTQQPGVPQPTQTPSANGPQVARLVLVNADTDRDIAVMTNNMTIDLAALPTRRINVRAETNPTSVGSVLFDLNGVKRTENGAPYALYSDDYGNYRGETPALGDYTLGVTAYTSGYLGGKSGPTLTLRFKVVSGSSAGPTSAAPTATKVPPTATKIAPTATQPSASNLRVASFTLVDANTHKDIMTLTNGAIIDMKTLPTTKLSVRANTNPGQVGSVKMQLNSYLTVENLLPYALYGDDNTGKYYGRNWSAGDYTMTGVAYSKTNQSGVAGQALTVSFKLVTSQAAQPTATPRPTSAPTQQPITGGPQVASLVLLNADNDRDILTLTDGMTIDLKNLPSQNVSVRANTNPAAVGSVKFVFNGSTTTENGAPYALYSDDAGNYHGRKWAVGSYTLAVTAYTQMHTGGNAGPTRTVRFTVIDGGGSVAAPTSVPPTKVPPTKVPPTKVPPTSVPPTPVPPTPQPAVGPDVVSFTLVNSETDRDIRTLVDGETLNLAELPRNLTIRANTNPATVGSVLFSFAGRATTENAAPYALYGDNNGDYYGVSFATGNYTLSATAYSRTNNGGVAGRTLTVRFRFIHQGANPTPVPPTPKPVQPTAAPPQPTAVPPQPTAIVPTLMPSQVPPTAVPTPVIGGGLGLTGQYYNTPDLTGPFALRLDPMIAFNWDQAAPMPGMPVDFFSVRWTGWVEAQYTETYTFTTFADDGTRLYINGVEILNDWSKHWVREASGSIALVAGQRYEIRLEYFDDDAHARVDLLWSSPRTPKSPVPMSQLYPAQVTVPPTPQPTVDLPTPIPVVPTETPVAPAPIPSVGTGLTGEYFNTPDLTGTAQTRQDALIAFNWEQGAPMPGMPVDFFSVRWTGQIVPQYSETYTFTTFADDGTRLYIDGVEILNDWSKHWVREASGSIALVAGQRYDIRLEYFDDDAHARVDLLWSSPSTPKSIIPTSQLYPAVLAVPIVPPAPLPTLAPTDQGAPIPLPTLAPTTEPLPTTEPTVEPPAPTPTPEPTIEPTPGA